MKGMVNKRGRAVMLSLITNQLHSCRIPTNVFFPDSSYFLSSETTEIGSLFYQFPPLKMVKREIIQKMIQFSARTKPFEAGLGKIKVLSAGNGKLEAEMKVEEEHTNMFGTLHGGFTATIVDCMSGFALLTHPKLVDKLESSPHSGVSVDIHVTYIRAAAKGEEIIIKADTSKAGKRLAFLNVIIESKKTGDILAKGSHTKFIG